MKRTGGTAGGGGGWTNPIQSNRLVLLIDWGKSLETLSEQTVFGHLEMMNTKTRFSAFMLERKIRQTLTTRFAG